jgi:hypothetical protein
MIVEFAPVNPQPGLSRGEILAPGSLELTCPTVVRGSKPA